MGAADAREQRTLTIVLAINAVMFVAELTLGWVAESTGLIADSLDMLADASVYGISLYAVGKSASVKNHAAMASGVGQVALAGLVLLDVLRRFKMGSEPIGALMMSVGLAALLANSVCVMLISRHRDGGVHMRASLIFSTNDVIANLGVMASGALVWVLDSRYPDLLIGVIIAVVVLRGGVRIMHEARTHSTAPRLA